MVTLSGERDRYEFPWDINIPFDNQTLVWNTVHIPTHVFRTNNQ